MQELDSKSHWEKLKHICTIKIHYYNFATYLNTYMKNEKGKYSDESIVPIIKKANDILKKLKANEPVQIGNFAA